MRPQVRRTIQRFGGDAAARRPLLGDRKCNTYSHVLPALQRDAATRMNARFRGVVSISVSVRVSQRQNCRRV